MGLNYWGFVGNKGIDMYIYVHTHIRFRVRISELVGDKGTYYVGII